ncbi:MAG TPA: serine/threonine-protein kinase [Gemmataceae bacterium]|jgi:serine/threonine-protein kinase
MSNPPHVNRKTFLNRLRRSKLLTEARLARVLRKLPATNRGRVLARILVEKELLTRFQAEQLLAGRTAGFQLGQYRILDQLGRGGMGRVFKAEHRTLKRLVALKVLAPNLLQSERARELFLREVRAAAQLVHPNVVTAFDANEEAGRYYLALEYIDGPNLDQLVRKQGPLPVGLACDCIKQAANGLQAAHLRGMVHRDIKPANILVQRHGQQEHSPGLVKISDFGLARLHAPEMPPNAPNHAGTILTRQDTVMGTPDFLSPEQARDMHRADIRSDLYSLGCTFYYLLTGRVVFPGGTALEKLIRHGAETPTPLAELRPDVPAAVVEIVQRLLAKRPKDRYQTPAELAAALEPFAVSGPTPWAPPPSSPYLDAAVTPVSAPSRSSRNILEGISSEELSAMTKTEPPDLSPTPVNAPDRPRRPRSSARLPAASRRRTRALAWIAGAAAAALVAGLAVLMALRGW